VAANGSIRHRTRQETPMSRSTLPEPPRFADEDGDLDFDAWSLDDLDNFADEHLPAVQASHDSDD
jgi:hypothetical protein